MTRRLSLLSLSAAYLTMILAAPAYAGKPSKPAADSTPPNVTIAAPGAGSTVDGTASVTGTAVDDSAVSKVEIRVDGGAYVLVTGTGSWAGSLNTAAYADGSHTVTARATDKARNVSVTSVALWFDNAPEPTPTPTPTPTPSPEPDTTAPTVGITSPAASATLRGTVNVTGTASDDYDVAKVEVAVDGAAWNLATGTSAWSWGWDTTAYGEGSHTIAARATDTAGNATTIVQSHVVQNSSTSGGPTLPAGVKEQLVTPEGATIQIFDDVTGWTAQQIYDKLKPSAYELDKLGARLTVKVQTTYASQTTTSASTTDGIYRSFKATIYLKAVSSTSFTSRPDFVVAHEYGHAWSMYHLYLTQQADWSAWLRARALTGDSRLDSSYNWSKNEMIADDYRVLFGSEAAVSQMAYLNSDVPDPRSVAGLKDFLAMSW